VAVIITTATVTFVMKFFLLLFFFFNLLSINSQNLVPNYSFEEVDSCALNDNIYYCSGHSLTCYCSNWFDNYNCMFSSSDLVSQCSFYFFDMPNSLYGYSYPKTGNNYVNIGLIGFYPSNGNESGREHSSVELLNPLLKDSAYCVSFYYKNSNYLTNALDNLGVLFTYDTLRTDTVLQRQADIRTEKGVMLTEYEDWVEFSGYYIAKGGEKFINIGLFGPKEDTQFEINSINEYSVAAFVYFFDDISVYQCNKDSIFKVVLEIDANVFSPNGDNVNDIYTFKVQNISEMNFQVYNRWGNVVYQTNEVINSWDGTTNNGKPLLDGVYFIVINAVDKYGNILQKSKTVSIFSN